MCHCTGIGCTAEGRHQHLWQFLSSKEIQKSCSFATQQQKLTIPSMRFIQTTLFQNPLCTAGMSHLKIIKIHKKMISVVGLQCQGTTKCSQRSHNEAHSKSHFLYWNSLRVCRMPFSGEKAQGNGQKLGPAPQQHALSNCPCSAAVFGAEPHCSNPPTTVPTRSHSMQLLSLLKAQGQTLRSSFYICRRNSTEYCSMPQSHIKRWLPETIPAMAGLLEQYVCAEGSRFQGDWVTFYIHPF